jgi:hypothetical protein
MPGKEETEPLIAESSISFSYLKTEQILLMYDDVEPVQRMGNDGVPREGLSSTIAIACPFSATKNEALNCQGWWKRGP